MHKYESPLAELLHLSPVDIILGSVTTCEDDELGEENYDKPINGQSLDPQSLV